MYDDWTYADQTVDWIQDHGSANTWGGHGKSLRMDIRQDNHIAKVGPSRFGLYFGSDTEGVANGYATHGLANSGHDKLYLFYMVKLPTNIFPTEDGGVITSSQPLVLHLPISRTINGATERKGTGCRWEYGCGDVLIELKLCGSVCDPEFSNTLVTSGSNVVYDLNGEYYTQLFRQQPLKGGGAKDFINKQAVQGKWFGLEFRVTRGTPGNYDGELDIWVYDELGNSTHIYTNTNLIFQQKGTDFAFNKFFFGGNISYQPEADSQNLDVTYFVDDFILDSERIGPKYFSLFLGKKPSCFDTIKNGEETGIDCGGSSSPCPNKLLLLLTPSRGQKTAEKEQTKSF